MINRRHIRVKVMQSIYVMLINDDSDIVKEEKFLYLNCSKALELYVVQLQMLVALKEFTRGRLEILKKNRVTTIQNSQAQQNLSTNKMITILENSVDLNNYCKNNNVNSWQDTKEYVQIIYNETIASSYCKDYNELKNPTFNDDKEFVKAIFKNLIAPNEKLIDFYENFHLGWMDDLSIVNTAVLKSLNKINPKDTFVLKPVYKDQDDFDFTKNLFLIVMEHHASFNMLIDELTPNWEFDRIATIDLILIKMAMTEFLFFPTIPTKVSLNEYIEISKDYSSQKSSFFINGVLDKISRKFKKEKKINKTGRGLQ